MNKTLCKQRRTEADVFCVCEFSQLRYFERSSKDDALTALIHLGYLGYDCDESTAYIPNYEVANAFHSAMKKSSWSDISKLYQACNDIINATIRCDADNVRSRVEKYTDGRFTVESENGKGTVVTISFRK